MLCLICFCFLLNPLHAYLHFVPIGGGRSRCQMMSGSAAAAIDELKPRSVPVLDAQAAGIKAERLWGMADAQKPVSMASENTMRDVSLPVVSAREQTAV